LYGKVLQVEGQNKPISTIINELANVGFKICKVVEESRIPEDDDSSPSRNPSHNGNQRRYRKSDQEVVK
jgi:hypothetical protein